MRYTVEYDSFTKLAETTGTIQNADTILDVEVNIGESPYTETLTLTLPPLQTLNFVNQEISVRCAEKGGRAQVRVVDFIARRIK